MQQVVEALILNNPRAVRDNLMNFGIVTDGTVGEVTRALRAQAFENPQQAASFAAHVLTYDLNPDGPYFLELKNQLTGNPYEYLRQSFLAAIRQPNTTNHNQTDENETIRVVFVLLALIGLLTVLTVVISTIKKIIL